MLSKIWSSLKRATVGEKIQDVGQATGAWGATSNVDIRRVSNGQTFVTLSVSSNITIEINGRTTTYAYLDDAAVEKLAAHLSHAIEKRQKIV